MQPDEDILHDGRDITKRVRKLWDTAISMKNYRRNDVVNLMNGCFRFWLVLHNYYER